MPARPETKKDHSERINQVIQYVHSHMDEPLDLEYLAQISCYSPFHFHRVMRAFIGESIGAYIVRIRLDAAASLLRMSDKAIADIAMDTGYENPSSFNKAFRKRFGVAPNEFRDNKRVPWVVQTNLKAIFMDNTALKPKIKEIKEKKVIYVQSIGDYNKTAKPAWEKVCGFAQKHKLFGFSTEMIGISYDDPSITEPDRCRYEACVAVSKEVKPEGEVGFKTIPAGKYAVFNFKGPYEKLHEAYDYIFGKYIPENKIELRNAPCFEKYLNSPDKTKPENLKTEICIPIE